jgi:1-acyl-sn-glycerol-3-phosphate acyltransferase
MRAELAETILSAARGNAAHPGVFRLPAIAVRLAWGIAAAAWVFPFASRATRLALRQRWASGMLDAIGLELRVEGETIAPGALLVTNHVSWLDILVLASRTPAVFVAKSEVRRWPAIGWLAARAETLFLRRASGRSLLEVKNRVAGLLLEDRAVAFFPEGTTSDGAGVLPFRSGLLQAAVDGDRAVQPIAIAYCDEQGRRSAAAVFVDGMTLWRSIVAVCASGRITARLAVAAPLAAAGRTRKALAREAHDAVAAIVEGRN